MLFRKKIERSCSYCAYSTKLDDTQALCVKKGVVDLYGKCRKFCYDPTKRIPPKPKTPDFDQFSKDDFSL
jgi:hypothetical protein